MFVRHVTSGQNVTIVYYCKQNMVGNAAQSKILPLLSRSSNTFTSKLVATTSSIPHAAKKLHSPHKLDIHGEDSRV